MIPSFRENTVYIIIRVPTDISGFAMKKSISHVFVTDNYIGGAKSNVI